MDEYNNERCNHSISIFCSLCYEGTINKHTGHVIMGKLNAHMREIIKMQCDHTRNLIYKCVLREHYGYFTSNITFIKYVVECNRDESSYAREILDLIEGAVDWNIVWQNNRHLYRCFDGHYFDI